MHLCFRRVLCGQHLQRLTFTYMLQIQHLLPAVGEKEFFALFLFSVTQTFAPLTELSVRPVQQGKFCSASPADFMIEGFKNILHMPPKYVTEDLLIFHNHHINQRLQ